MAKRELSADGKYEWRIEGFKSGWYPVKKNSFWKYVFYALILTVAYQYLSK